MDRPRLVSILNAGIYKMSGPASDASGHSIRLEEDSDDLSKITGLYRCNQCIGYVHTCGLQSFVERYASEPDSASKGAGCFIPEQS